MVTPNQITAGWLCQTTIITGAKNNWSFMLMQNDKEDLHTDCNLEKKVASEDNLQFELKTVRGYKNFNVLHSVLKEVNLKALQHL